MTFKKKFILYVLPLWVCISSLCGAESLFKNKITKESSTGAKTLLFADEFLRDDKAEIITARGHVEITRDNKTVYADQICFNQKTDVVTAIGNVRLHDVKGDIIFASYAELTRDLKEGFVDEVRAILSDDSLLAANESHRIEDTKNQLDFSVYSPCKLCKKDPLKPPLWQIKARHVVLDEETDDITHTDALMEFFGVPVAYTPYLRHPGPAVKRRSGFLSPLYAASKDLGPIIGLPYFWVIDESKDLTITPVYTKINPLLFATYRQRFCHGQFRFDFSITKRGNSKADKEALQADPTNSDNDIHKYRGHIDTEGLFDLTKNWRAGFDIVRVLDDTYFRRYKILGHTDDSFLTSRIYGERFTERNYVLIESMNFQGLRLADRNSFAPFIAPSVDMHFVKGPSLFDGTFYVDGNFLNLMRERGTKMQRFSAKGEWRKETIFHQGSVLSLGASLRQDLYHVEDFNFRQKNSLVPSLSKYSGDQGRLFPQLYANLKYPLVKMLQYMRLLIEPVVGVVIGPAHLEKNKIPDEDSNIFEFNDVNLFSPLRVAGLDRVDPGSRLNWGLRMALYSTTYVNSELFLGQSYALTRPDEMLRRSGVREDFSDYVARASLSYSSYASIEGRFLICRKTFSTKRNESTASVGPQIFRLSATYSRLPNITVPRLATEQVIYGITSKFSQYWTGTLSLSRELGRKRKTPTGPQGGELSRGVGLTYEDECFTFQVNVTKTFYEDRDVRPGTTGVFRFIFKNLGPISFSTDQLGLTDSTKKTHSRY